jgi:hypothetical protein
MFCCYKQTPGLFVYSKQDLFDLNVFLLAEINQSAKQVILPAVINKEERLNLPSIISRLFITKAAAKKSSTTGSALVTATESKTKHQKDHTYKTRK